MLESVLKEGGFATLALVSTGEDLREWTYYVKSETEFTARLNYALAGVPAFPIEIHAASDPDWDMLAKNPPLRSKPRDERNGLLTTVILWAAVADLAGRRPR